MGPRPEQGALGWQDVDLALAADPADGQVRAFADSLPKRLDGPDLKGQPAPAISFNNVEAEALTCYATAGERDAYLGTVTREVARIAEYIRSINAYLEALGQRDQAYQARGYDLHTPIMQELDRWRAPGEAAKKRSDALQVVWFPYAAATMVVPCAGAAPGRLRPPRDYDPTGMGKPS